MCGGMAVMDGIMNIVNEHQLTLVEDAGQAFGASHKGTYVGLFGKTGCYSFDFFKIATAGEGGVLVTNDEMAYKLADSYSDHGHDHQGNNRGMEEHPIIGFNYRISELHAAIGKVQTSRVPHIMQKNNHNKKLLTQLLSTTTGISFATICDPNGDSATFLNILLPDTATTQAVVDAFNKAGVTGFNYWYTNMYHFINQWDHIKNLQTASKLPIEVLGKPQDYNNLHLPISQQVVGRLISFGIRCTWTDEEIHLLAKNITACVESVLVPIES